jgi:hypothetical protein
LNGEVELTQITRTQRQRLTLLILIIAITCISITQSSSKTSIITSDPLLVYQIANPLSVYQSEHLDMSVSITNYYFQQILNVTVKGEIAPELEFISSTIHDFEGENVTDEFEHDFGKLSVNGNINFTVTYNVTSPDPKTINLKKVNVTYTLLNGIETFQLAEPTTPIEILLKGVRETTRTDTRSPIPSGSIPAHDSLSVIGYVIPLLAYAISIVILRRIRH